MAGGVGSRFWPASRENKPKQLLPIVNQESMLLNTIRRVLSFVNLEDILIIGGVKQESLICEDIKSIDPNQQIKLLFEPVGRNTAPAILLGVAYFDAAQEITLVLPADHHIQDEENFRKNIRLAEKAANAGNIVTLGIKPTYPETGYGYIKAGQSEEGVFKVDEFCEKPDTKTAKNYLASGDYFWNAGIFIFKNEVIMAEAKEFIPDTLNAINEISKAEFTAVSLEAGYSSMEGISVDYAIMEKTRKISLVPAEFSWNDVGSWKALDEVRPKDDKLNVKSGDIFTLDAKNNIVVSPNKFTAVLGMENTIVVDTKDALLICNKDDAQSVKSVVDYLKANHPELL
jgi:mannose-1-phosphate guanylyltransferase/mannose-6-phosphate isomerase